MAAPPHPAQVILPQYLTNNLPLAAQPQPVYYTGLWIPVPVVPLHQPPFQLYTNMSPTGLAPAQPFPQPATPTFTGPFWVSKKRFQVKFTANRAKGNFYISKDNIDRMRRLCHETFRDERVAFSYYKESVAMQINDRQIERIWINAQGVELMVIHIDLHFKANPRQVMYLVAGRNDSNFSSKVEWAIYDFMRAVDLHRLGISFKDLPRSSRDTQAFREGLRCRPTSDVLSGQLIWNTDFKGLPAKTSMRNKCEVAGCKCKKFTVVKGKHGHGHGHGHGSWPMHPHHLCKKCGHGRSRHGVVLPVKRVSIEKLRCAVEQSKAFWRVIPVVVIKGKEQWIEWKKFVRVLGEWVAISLRYHQDNNQWRIVCMDYDAGRIFNQHRLVGCVNHGVHEEIARHITTSLDIYYQHQYRPNNRR